MRRIPFFQARRPSRSIWRLFTIIFVFALAGFGDMCERALAQLAQQGPQAGRNVNMVSGTDLPGGDPFRQRQDEPSVAISTRNLQHLVSGANDYRTVDLPGVADAAVHRDSWLGLFKSFDGGNSWNSTLIPGYPQDRSPEGMASPLKGFQAGSDPAVRAGAGGLFYYLGIVFNRTDDKDGVLFVSRLVDNNNKESGDPIVYVDTNLVHKGNKKHFLDKPWLAVDIPRAKKDSCTIRVPDGKGGFSTQTFPGGNVYASYADIDDDDPNATRLMFTRSTNCGVTWEGAVRLSDPHTVNQGSVIGIDPNTGNVYVAWRQIFLSNVSKSATDAIMIAKSVNGGIAFGKPVTVSKIVPFDLATLPSPADCTGNSCYRRFRTDTFPTLTVDANADPNRPGRVYVAWSELGRGPVGDARIVLSVSQDNAGSFSAPAVVDNADGKPGHQMMPSMTFAAGKLMLIFYDFRGDRRPIPQEYLADPVNPNSNSWHTADVRAAQADPANNPVFVSSQISRYLYVLDSSGKPVQAQANPVNYPMFSQGRVPFMGDYIDVTAPLMIQDKSGQWKFNTQPTSSPVFQSVWTDNRDVIPPPKPQDWTKYTPAGSPGGTQSIFDPSKTVAACVGGVAGMRNQNVYSARITQGLVVSSPGNAKPLGKIQRAFVVYVENTTNKTRFYRMTITEQPVGGKASFLQFEQRNSLDVTVAPRSSISRIVFMTSGNPRASAKVDVTEILSIGGAPVIGGNQSAVVLNPDILNPDILNPDILNPDILNPDILNFEVSNPDISNAALTDLNNDGKPDVINPDILNPDILNPDILNPDILNPDILNPDILNPDILNPDILNPDILNPDILNPDILNTDPDVVNADKSKLQINDLFWNVTNKGNTTTVFTFKLAFPKRPKGFKFQLLLYRTTSTPAVAGCVPVQQAHEQLVANIQNPDILNPDILNPDILNSDVRNSSIFIAPGEAVKVQLRVFDLDKFDSNVIQIKSTKTKGAAIRNFTANAAESLDLDVFEDVEIGGEPLTASVVSQSVDTADAQAGITQPKASTTRLTVTTTVLASGRVGEFFLFQLDASGGTAPVVWGLAPGSTLPSSLTLSSTGLLSGTPTTVGTFAFTVLASDADGQVAARDLTLTVLPPLGTPSLGFVTQPDTCTNTATPDANCVRQDATITPPVSVRALNAAGAPVANLAISIALGTNTGAGVLTGTTTALTNASGIVAFGDLQISRPGTYTLVATASGFAAVSTSAFNVIPKITITTTALPNGTVGAAYDTTIFAFSGIGARTWSVASGGLPGGLFLDPDAGRILGSPAATGTSNVMVSVTDSGNPQQSDTRALSITVLDNPPDLALTATVSSGAFPRTLAASGLMSYLIVVTNQGTGPAANVTLTDALPAGLTNVTCVTTAGTCQSTPGAVTASLGTLAAGASANLTIAAYAPAVAAQTTITNTATVSTSTFEPSTGNNQVTTNSIVNPLAGPPGAAVQTFTIDPSNSNIIYAGTDSGGLFKTFDGGSDWISFLPTIVPVRGTVYSGNTVNVGTSFGLYRSTDAGATWTVNVTINNVASIVMDPLNSSVIYAGRSGTSPNTVYKSTDTGATWVSSGNGLPSSQVNAIAIDKNNTSVVYVGTGNSGVYKSTDGGATWNPVNNLIVGLSVQTIVIDPSNTNIVYAGTTTGVSRSIDGGANWTTVNNGLTSVAALSVFALAIDPSATGTIYAATNGGVYKTTTSGGTWVVMNTGLLNSVGRAIAIDPITPSKVYVGTGWGVSRSTNGGGNWTEISNGLSGMKISSLLPDPANPGALFAASDALGAVWRTGDSGATWARANGTGVNVQALTLDASGMLYAGATNGMYKSSTGGASWALISTGLTNTNIRSVAADPANSGTLFAGTTTGGLFKTSNGGATWAASNTGISAAFNTSALAVTNTAVYAASQGAGVYKSIDGGSTWTLINNGLSNTTVNALAIHPSNPSTIYAGTNSGVFKTVDGGLNWAAMNTGLAALNTQAIAIDPTNTATLYVGTTSSLLAQIFKSTDGGATWAGSSTGLTNPIVKAFAFDLTNSSIVYAGTVGGGVFKSINAGASWQPSGNSIGALPAQLTVSMTQSPAVVSVPGTVLYTVTISNIGGAAASNVAATIQFAGNFVSCTTSLGSCPGFGGAAFPSIGTLPAGAVVTVLVTAELQSGQSSGSASVNVTTSSAQASMVSNQTGLNLLVNPPAGPLGALVQAFAVDPTNPNTILAGTDGGGVFKTTDAGADWSTVNAGFASLSTRALLTDGASPGVVYAGTGSGVYKSSNTGASWTAMNSGLTSTNTFSLAMHPTAPGTLYAGTTNGIFKTTNGAVVWTASSTGLTTTFSFGSIAIDTTNPNTLYAASSGAGMFKSSNAGASWTGINVGLTSLTARAVVIDPTNSNVIYVGTSGGVFKSIDAGANWTLMNSGLGNTTVFALNIDPASASTIYASTGGGTTPGGVYRSTNGGTSWSALNSGLTSPVIRAFAIVSSNNTAALYAGTAWGVYKSTDNGTNWNEANSGMYGMRISSVLIDPGNSSVIYAGSDGGGGVFKSTDSGATWARGVTNLTNTFVRAMALDASGLLTLYTANASGVSKSTIPAVNWTTFGTNAGLTNTDARSFALDPSNSSIAYVGTLGGVFKTTNGGTSWTAMNTGLTTTFAIASLVIDRTNTLVSYAASQGAGVFKSTDGGSNWTAVNAGLTNTTVNVLLLDSVNNLYAGTSGGGVFKSTDGGTSWNAMNTGLGGLTVNALALHPTSPGTIFAGTTGGVFKTTNSAATWSGFSTGLTRTDVRSFAIDPVNNLIIYAGTSGGGVFKSTDGGVTWQPTGSSSGVLPAQLSVSLTQTPNPVTGGGTVVYTVTVTNLGGTPAENVTMNLVLPPSMTFVSCFTFFNCVNEGSTVSVSLNPLGPGGGNVGFQVTAAVGQLVSQVSATATANVSTTSTQLSTSTNQSTLTITLNPLSGPPTGEVLTLAVHPVNQNIVLAGTNGGGVFRTTDGGATWTAVDGGLTGLFVRSIVVDNQNPFIAYAGTSAGVFKSVNDGNGWFVVGNFNSGLTNSNVFALVADPTAPFTLYAATSTGGVFKTTNGGNTWIAANTGITTATTIDTIVIDPFNTQILYAGSQGGGIFKSTNGGTTWAAVGSNPTNLDIRALAIDPSNSTIMYAATNGGGVFKSTNSGSSWTAMNNGILAATVSGSNFQALLIDRFNPAVVYVGTNGPGVFKSSDGAANWTAASSGMTNQNVLANTTINAFVADATGSTLYAATRGGVFKSVNGAASWTAASAGLDAAPVSSVVLDPKNPSTIYAGINADSVYKSTDGGMTWSASNSGIRSSATRALAIDPSNTSTLYLGRGAGGNGLQKTTNGGFSWSSASTGPLANTPSGIDAFVIDPSNTSTVYAGGAAGIISTTGSPFLPGVFKSTDAGATWSTMNVGLTNTDVRAIATDASPLLTLYAGTFGGGVFKSTDGAANWASMTAGLTNLNVLAIAMDASAPLTVYAGTSGGGVFKSTNGAASWSAMNSGLTGLTVQALAVEPTNASVVYAGTTGGLLKTTNCGTTWTNSGFGLTNSNVLSLAIDPLTHTTLYAGTNGGGLFKSVDSGATWQPTGATLVPFSTLVSMNDAVFGQGSITRDVQSGFDWLDLTKTTNRSVQNVDAQLAPGGQFQGFRRATAAEVLAFFSHAGIPFIDTAPFTLTPHVENAGPVQALMSLWGITGSFGTFAGSSFSQAFIADRADLEAPVYYQSLLSYVPQVNAGFASTLASSGNDTTSDGTIGHALIRYSSPVTSSVTVTAGNGQNSAVTTSFATALQVIVKNSNGLPVAGVAVTFNATTSGASGTFVGGSSTAIAITNANGFATAPAFTANSIAGTYNVNATVAGVVAPATFTLTNTAGPVSTITVFAGSGQNAIINSPFAIVFQVLVKDAFNNPASGVNVTFAAPVSGPSGTFPGGVTNVAVSTNNGLGFAPAFTANGFSGNYTVTASVTGVAVAANFNLTNIVTLSSLSYSIPNLGGLSATTAGVAAFGTGYAKIIPDAGKTTPAGAAILDYLTSGVLVDEAAVPVSGTLQNGRMRLEVNGVVDTGLFIANPNPQSATVMITATSGGVAAFTSTYNVPANGGSSLLVSQLLPGISNFQGTLDISSDVPVAATGARTFTNERSDFIFTFIPVFEVGGAGVTALAHYADGSGGSTQVVMVNLNSTTIAGNVQFLSTTGTPVTLTANGQTANSFSYVIPPQGSFKLTTSGTGSLTSGSVRINPLNSPPPAAYEILDYRVNNVSVSEAAAVSVSGNAFRMYAETSGTLGSIQSYVSVANPSPTDGLVTFEFTDVAGNSLATPVSRNLAGNGELTTDLGQLFPSVTFGAKGVLRVSSTLSGLWASEFRGRFNQRNDFLLSGLPVTSETLAAPSTAMFIPLLEVDPFLVDQFVLYSGYANQSTTGQIQFFNQFGSPLNVDLLPTNVVVPGTAEGNVNNIIPFSLGSPFEQNITGRYQQVYSSGSFPAQSVTIRELAFRLDEITSTLAGSSTLGNVIIKLSTTTKAVDGLDATFANNVTSPATTVYSGTLNFSWSSSSGAERPFDLKIPLQQAFGYNPAQGNLLLDITVIVGNDPATSSTPTFDAASVVGDGVSRAWIRSASTTGWQTTTGSLDSFGLVTRFTFY